MKSSYFIRMSRIYFHDLSSLVYVIGAISETNPHVPSIQRIISRRCQENIVFKNHSKINSEISDCGAQVMNCKAFSSLFISENFCEFSTFISQTRIVWSKLALYSTSLCTLSPKTRSLWPCNVPVWKVGP